MNLKVGVAQVSLYFRYSQSLKDKRQILQSVIKKLRNAGFSVAECGHPESPKQGSIGFSLVGTSAEHLDIALSDAIRLFDAECEIISSNKDVFDYSQDDSETFASVPDDDDPFAGR